MSQFMSEVVLIDEVTAHPNADSLDIAMIGDYCCITRKGRFQKGAKVVYLQTDTVLPDELKEELELPKNRIRPIRLRGIFSEGVLLEAKEEWEVGSDVSEILMTKKYEPPTSANLRGNNIRGFHRSKCVSYDFENIKKYGKHLFYDTDEESKIPLKVTVTEKIHGTWVQFGIFKEDVIPDSSIPWLVVSSKGRAHKGFVLNVDDDNVYSNMAHKLLPQLEKIREDFILKNPESDSIVLMGEIFGNGVQDMSYDLNDVRFRAFDLALTDYSKWKGADNPLHVLAYMRKVELRSLCESLKIDMVPIDYVGDYDPEVVLEKTNSKSSVASSKNYLKEGVVVTYEPYDVSVPYSVWLDTSHHHPRFGRRIAKSISEKYLLRKNGTESQ